jgi:peptidoglycan hydrolase-like protein with peptidoglycan-binding domain
VIARNGDSINAATSSLSALVYTASNAVSSGGIAIPVNSASQGGVPFNPSPVVSPAPIAVPPVSGIPVSSGSGSGSRVVFTKTLTLGSTGAQVVALQQKLRELGLFTFPSNTGYFGSITKKAVVVLQKQHNLKPYPGIVGPLLAHY